jgi:3-phosphoshikimate 1-carboxyvinyltransferase
MHIDPRGLKPSVLTPPQSKSDAQRALVLAWILGWPELQAQVETESTDVATLAAGLKVIAHGSGTIDCHDGGAPFRFLLALAATTAGRFTFTGSARLAARPRSALTAALGIEDRGSWPLVVDGVAVRAPPFVIDASESSQFPSALLLAAARLERRENRPWSRWVV